MIRPPPSFFMSPMSCEGYHHEHVCSDRSACGAHCIQITNLNGCIAATSPLPSTSPVCGCSRGPARWLSMSILSNRDGRGSHCIASRPVPHSHPVSACRPSASACRPSASCPCCASPPARRCPPRPAFVGHDGIPDPRDAPLLGRRAEDYFPSPLHYRDGGKANDGSGVRWVPFFPDGVAYAENWFGASTVRTEVRGGAVGGGAVRRVSDV
ncbi:hypothetical protein F4780DRAFT_727437 [Xylariomycetidae sp. FL0641]|nr:hypothetical protein F4780DRAFT_727437 [Xylariomycetidae sp. FL0641]